MLGITVRAHSEMPIFKQLVAQFKKLIADSRLKPGEHLPPVRDLAVELKIAPATVARAYQELMQEGLVGASRRRGTIVLGDTDSPQRLPIRQNQLTVMVNSLILEALSLGNSPDELEDSFQHNLAQWHKQKESTKRRDTP